MEFRNQILVGDVIARLRELPDECVHTVVTSPPYWGLRDYGMPGQIGLEPTPELFVERMVDVFREIRRVLRSDGTLWLNMGDSYVTGSAGPGSSEGSTLQGSTGGQDESKKVKGAGRRASFRRDRMERQDDPHKTAPRLKPKDMLGMPWRLAFALQADGWWLRMDNVWSKPNPMPESVTDRPSKSHEYVFLLSKSETYFYDAEAIREPMTESSMERISQPGFDDQSGGPKAAACADHRNSRTALVNLKKKVVEGAHGTMMSDGLGMRMATKWNNPLGRNKRSVWVIPTEAYPDAHFATFPQKLVEPCVLAGTSEGGCCSICGTPLKREFKKELIPTAKAAKTFVVDGRDQDADAQDQGSNRQKDGHKPGWINKITTMGWTLDCSCGLIATPAKLVEPCVLAGTSEIGACLKCGAPYERVIDVEYANPGNRTTNGPRSTDRKHLEFGTAGYTQRLERRSQTVGWKPTCSCDRAFIPGVKPCIVLDPFMGSGTTALVALRANRNFVGIELNPAYAELARKRIEPELSQLKLM